MADLKRLKDALEVVCEECSSHINCEDCPFYRPTRFDGDDETGCYLCYYTPYFWDTLLKDGEQDTVQVVRCKHCAVPHNYSTGCPKLGGLIPPENFYCASGKRKDNEHDTTC